MVAPRQRMSFVVMTPQIDIATFPTANMRFACPRDRRGLAISHAVNGAADPEGRARVAEAARASSSAAARAALRRSSRAAFTRCSAAAARARPSRVRVPVDKPPCIRHRPLRGAAAPGSHHATHPAPKQASDFYTRLEMQWPALCEAILRLRLPEGTDVPERAVRRKRGGVYGTRTRGLRRDR